MTLNSKEIVADKFWILENNEGLRQGTMRQNTGSVIVNLDNQTLTYESLDDACWNLSINMAGKTMDVSDVENNNDMLMNFPIKCPAFNSAWDVKKKIPVFTKTAKSRTLHAAGYFIIKFNHGWTQSFCPKVSTLDANEYQGPFKSKIECRARLAQVSKQLQENI